MREHSSNGLNRASIGMPASRVRSSRRPDLGEPPIARLGSKVGMPRAIFTEDDDTTLGDLARIARKASPIRRRGSVAGPAN